MDQSECISQGFLAKQNQYIWIVKIEIGSCDFGGYEVLITYDFISYWSE